MLSIRTCDMCRAVMGPWLGERLSSVAVSTQCTQHGSGEGGGVPSQLKVIQLRGTADPPSPLYPFLRLVCAGRFRSTSLLLVCSPLTVRMNVLQLGGAAGQQDAGDPTKPFLFLPGCPR